MHVSETVLGMIGCEMALRGGVSSQLEAGDSLTLIRHDGDLVNKALLELGSLA